MPPGPRFVRFRAWLARGLGALTRAEKIILAIGVPIYIAVHRVYAVRVFGEDDAANFVTDAIFWHFSGSVSLDHADYRVRTSPLYVHSLERAMHFGVPIGSVPWLMTLGSLLSSTAILLVCYFLFRPLVGRGAAAAAVGLLAITPGMWLGANYGMAHIPALAFWMASLLTLSLALDTEVKSGPFWGRLAAATTCAFVALSFKADLILTGFAFPGLAFAKKQGAVRTLVLAPAVALLGLAMQIGYARILMAGGHGTPGLGHSVDSTATYAAYWHERFPFDLEALTTGRTTDAALNCAGPFLTVAALLSLACLLFMPERARLGAWCLFWAMPQMLFWALIDGNSARHNIGAMPPLMLAVGALLARAAEVPWRIAALTGSVAFLNYFSDTHGGSANLGTMEPKTNLLDLSEGVWTRSEVIWSRIAPFGLIKDEKKAAIDRHWLAWAIFAEAAAIDPRARVTVEGRGFNIDRPGKPPQIVRFFYSDELSRARRVAQSYRQQGYVTWSASYPL